MYDHKKDSDILLKWFKKNFWKANSKKYHLFFNTDENNILKVGEISIANSKFEKLLGKRIDGQFCLIWITLSKSQPKP